MAAQHPNPSLPRHLNQNELARRWNISPRTAERWRWLGQGPCFLKLGGRVVYRMEDIEAFEAGQLRAGRTVVGHPTSESKRGFTR